MIRYLAHPVAGRSGDYTHDARRAIDPLPAVDPDTLAELAWRAQRHGRLTQIEGFMARHRQPVAARIERAKRQARFTGVDIRPELMTLRRAMETGRSDQCIAARLHALERKAFPEAA